MPLSLWCAWAPVRLHNTTENLRNLSKHKMWAFILSENHKIGDFLRPKSLAQGYGGRRTGPTAVGWQKALILDGGRENAPLLRVCPSVRFADNLLRRLRFAYPHQREPWVIL